MKQRNSTGKLEALSVLLFIGRIFYDVRRRTSEEIADVVQGCHCDISVVFQRIKRPLAKGVFLDERVG